MLNLGLCIFIYILPSKNLEKPKQREGFIQQRQQGFMQATKDEIILCEKGMER
jgi:hypothetical protein